MHVMLQFVGDVQLRTTRLFLHDALSDQSTIRNQQVSQAKSYAAFKIIGTSKHARAECMSYASACIALLRNCT
jgi:hypothetical protein